MAIETGCHCVPTILKVRKEGGGGSYWRGCSFEIIIPISNYTNIFASPNLILLETAFP